MKKFMTLLGAIALAMGMSVMMTAPASATENDTEVCVPSEAWTETVEHEAVGTPTIEVDNPDYIAPTYEPAWTEHVPAVYTPAVGTPTIEVEVTNPDYVPAVEPTEGTPAVGEPTIQVEVNNPDYVEAWTEYKDHAAVTHVEYKFVHKFDFFHLNPKWKLDPNWNAEGNPNSKGWILVGERTVVDSEAWTETIQHPAVGTPTIWVTIDNPDYVPAVPATPGSDAVGTPTIIVTQDNPDYVAPTYVAAYDIVHPAVYTPPVGDKTIVIDNPDYVPARVEVIEHEAVECPTLPVEGEKPAPVQEEKPEVLASTGADLGALYTGGIVFGLGLLLMAPKIARKFR